MQERAKNRKYQIFFTCTTVVMVVFIFTHSLMPAEMSSDESDGVLEILYRIADILHLSTEQINSYIVRKFAHYSEYVMIGMSLMCCGISYGGKKLLRYIFPVLFFGLLTPVIDETIQLYTPGRSGQVSDVCLDFLGVLTGITAVLLVVCAVRQLRKRKIP